MIAGIVGTLFAIVFVLLALGVVIGLFVGRRR